MGTNKQAAEAFAQSLTNFKDANPTATRAQRRKYVAGLVNRGHEWLAKFDAADVAAPAEFAATKSAQFTTFTDALADPVLTPVDPQS